MKRVGNIFEKVYDMSNLVLALDKACQGKRDKGFVRRIYDNKEYYLAELQNMLKNETYELHPNTYKTIVERSSQKQRELTIPKFYPDQILHWAACLQLQPIVMKGMYHYNCGSIPGRGCLYAKRYIDRILATDKEVKYVMKLDIKKFFPNVRNDKLKELLARKIKDTKYLRLLYAIIDNGGEGLPIGYYTSQWFSNFYLEALDHYIKEELKIRHHIRYVDDILLLDTDKEKLHNAYPLIVKFLADNNYGITIKDNWQLWRLHSRPIDFLGYKFYEHKTLLRNRIFHLLTRKVRRIEIRGYCTQNTARAIASLLGWLKHLPCGNNYYTKYICVVIDKPTISKIISHCDKRRSKMIIRENTDPKVEAHKRKINLTGDVYMIGNFMESLESHKVLIPDSTVETIEEAEQERIAYEAEQERLRAEAAALAAENELPFDDIEG